MYGEKLRKLRETANRTQKEIGEVAGVSQRSYAQWEAEQTEPSMDKLKKLADYFGVHVGYFYDEEPLYTPDPIRELIDSLIQKKIITDPNDIQGSVAEIILNAVRQDLLMKKVQQQGK